MCKDTNDPFATLYFYHYDDQQVEACKTQWCKSCQWSDGACPP
ncbi:MAG: hypothetical protein WKG01_19250 [Kofleriaceae bacterium]